MRIAESKLRKIVREEISNSGVDLVTESSNNSRIPDLNGIRNAVEHAYRIGQKFDGLTREDRDEQIRVLCLAIHSLTEILENEYEKKEKES